MSSPRASTARTSPGIPARIGLFLATVLVIIALAMLPLLTPRFLHLALDAAGSAERLGLTSEQTHALSDASVRQLVLGPGDFDISGPDGQPFYDADERSHLGDARLLFGIFFVAGGVALIGLAYALVRRPAQRTATWTVIRRAGLTTAVVVVLLGLISLIAFDSLFTLFHRLFFPGGNWAFDPATQHLVQLYPVRFWQIVAAAFGGLVFLLGLATWLLGRWQSNRGDAESTLEATSG